MTPRLRPEVSRRSLRLAFAGAALAWFGSAATSLAAIDASEWKLRQTFDLAQAGLTRIELPIETLDHSRSGFADLRLLDPSGKELPYAIELATPPAPAAKPARSFSVQIQKTSTVLTIETGIPTLLTAVELSTPARNFVKAARLETSSDGEHWDAVADGLQLARQPGLEATSLSLSKVRAAFLRVTIDDWRTPVVPFTGATLSLDAEASDDAVLVGTRLVKREEFVRETVLTVGLPAQNLPLASIEFTVADALFSRSVTVAQNEFRAGESTEAPLDSGVISRSHSLKPGAADHLTFSIEQTSTARQLQIHIANGDNPPLSIERVVLRRRPVRIVFHAPTVGTFSLLTGNVQAAAPNYDVTNLAADLGGVAETAVSVGSVEANPGYQPRDALADAPLSGPAIDVSGWKFRKPVTIANAGAQELELDLDVLAHARADLGDLRLVRDGRQTPYLIERSSLRRSLALPLQSAEDPKTPRFSRWKLPLPLAGIPISRITLRAHTALFERRIALFEMVADERGQTWRRELVNPVSWTRTPEHPDATLTIDLSSAPTTDAIFLETNNADNPPLVLATADAAYPVNRLLFRADTDPVELCYSRFDSSPPHYDLALIATRLLNEEKSVATLGPEESADGSSRIQKLASRGQGGALLWGALGLVVVVLLIVIARLLPKPPGEESK